MSNKKVKVGWDEIWVHGRHPDSDYIGRRTGRENTDALEQIAPYIAEAYSIRKEKHFEPVKEVQWMIIRWITDLLKKQKGVQ